MSANVVSLYPQTTLTLSAESRKGTDTVGSLTATACRHCGVTLTIYAVGDEYCRECSARIADLYRPRPVRFAAAKDLSPWGGAA